VHAVQPPPRRLICQYTTQLQLKSIVFNLCTHHFQQ
jgi:hypothetical protein